MLAFTNGLYNKKQALAVKQLRPKNLDEAYNLLRDEKQVGSIEETLCLVQDDDSRMRVMESQIAFLMRELQLLKTSTTVPNLPYLHHLISEAMLMSFRID